MQHSIIHQSNAYGQAGSLRQRLTLCLKKQKTKKERKNSQHFISFQRWCFFSVMKWIRHVVVSTQWFLGPCVLFSLWNKTLQRVPVVFKTCLEPPRFMSHPWPAICSSQICAFASLASPHPTTCSLLSAQTANYFSISCISDNQTSLVLYFLKHYICHPYTVHEENSM